MHHESLYIENLPLAIKDQYKDVDGLSEFEKEVFIDTSLAWELGELDMVGYVGLFHMWEKYSKDFVSRVFNKKCSEWPKLARMSYPCKIFTHLEKMEINIPVTISESLEEANTVVNAYKHGEEAIEKLQTKYPQYFAVPGEVESFCIPEGYLKQLFETVHEFWQEIEEQVEIEFNWQ